MNPGLIQTPPARSLRRVLTYALGLLLALACFSAFSSHAKAVSNSERFKLFSDFCISERADIYEWGRQGKLYGQLVTRPLWGDCSTPLSFPPRYVWSRVTVEKWNPYHGEYRRSEITPRVGLRREVLQLLRYLPRGAQGISGES